MSAFERGTHIYLAGGRKSLTFTLEGIKYFVSVKDVLRAIDKPDYTAQIVTVKPGEVDFSL